MERLKRLACFFSIVSMLLMVFTGWTCAATLSINLDDGTVVTYEASKVRSITISDVKPGYPPHGAIPPSTLPRTNFEKRLADLTRIKNALQAYYQRNYAYPSTEGRWDGLYSAWGQSKADWIPGLAPHYIQVLPRDPRMHTNNQQQYIYNSNGADYKLISHQPEDCDAVKRMNPALIDPNRNCWAYGFWTQGATNW